jgi:TonB family protein
MTNRGPALRRRRSQRAHEEYKRATRAIWWQMTCCAALLHFVVFLVNPNLRIDLLPNASWARPSVVQQFTLESLPADAIPGSPNLDSRPQVPTGTDIDLSENVTIAETTFEANPVESMPAPPMQVVQASPTIVPSYVGPEVLNVEQVLHRLRSGYSPLAKTTGAEGRVTLAFLVSTTGIVIDYRILESSGNSWLDAVALSIKDIVWFSPALEYGRKVDVWIRLPIAFAVAG